MIKVVTSQALKAAEKLLMQNGVSEDQLIARAAKYLYDEVISRVSKTEPIIAVAGSGNNGSDALECAIMLKESGYNIGVFTTGSPVNECNRYRREKTKKL